MSSIGQILRQSLIPAVSGAVFVYLDTEYIIPQFTSLAAGITSGDTMSLIIMFLMNAVAILIGVSIGTVINRSILG
jgi:hypothetical protein